MLKRLFCLILSFVLLMTSLTSFAIAQENITIKVNGNTLKLKANPINANGRILIPVAALTKELGITAEWVATTKSVIITQLTNNTTIYLKMGQASALVNGTEVKLECKPQIFKGRAYIPIRFISESLGAKVIWDSKTKTINITYEAVIQENPKILPLPWELQEACLQN